MELIHCIWGALWMRVVLLLLSCISIFRLQESWWAVLPPTPWRKRAIVGVGDLVMFEPSQWCNNNNYGDDDRENAIYLSWVLLFRTIFTLPKPLCIPCRCVPCWAVLFQLWLWREGMPATVFMALSGAMALSCQLAGCQTQQEGMLISQYNALLGLESKLSAVKSSFIFFSPCLYIQWGFSSENVTSKSQRPSYSLWNSWS